jgi:hypothetical protein
MVTRHATSVHGQTADGRPNKVMRVWQTHFNPVDIRFNTNTDAMMEIQQFDVRRHLIVKEARLVDRAETIAN